jgi:uncharacterized paraquat-inducible protein A
MIVRDYDDDQDTDDWEDDDPDDDTDECPHCGSSIYDDSERCPRCGHYLSSEDAPRRHPWWVLAGVVACLAMVSWWVLNFY